MLERFNTNPTQLTGLLAFAAATIACLIAAQRSGSRDVPIWRLLAVVNCLLLIEIFSGFRFLIHDFADAVLIASGRYAQRKGTQEGIIVVLAIIALIFMALFLFGRHAASRAVRAAASITIALLTLFAIETVSLHALDAVFYQPIGPVLMIGWLWATAAVGICLAATRG
jgi:hypothetical protein